MTVLSQFLGKKCIYNGEVWKVKTATPKYLHLESLNGDDAVLYVLYSEVTLLN